ncbi:MAG: bacteriocin [Mucilaginibacter sp.]
MKNKLTPAIKISPKNVLSKNELKQVLGGTGGSQTACTDKGKTGSVTDDPFSNSKPSGTC